MENQSIKEFVKDSKKILILLSRKPYLDQVAAGLSLYLALQKIGKDVSVVCPTPMTVEYNRLVGVNKITTRVGNKNLTIRLKNYDPHNVERVNYEVEGEKDSKELVLTVIPVDGQPAPRQDSIHIEYPTDQPDTVFLVGGANNSHFPDLAKKEISQAKVAHIGKQPVADNVDQDIISFGDRRASVSELMSHFVKELIGDFDSDIASNLLAGIREGTGDFTHPEVSAETFELTAQLMRNGAQRAPETANKSAKNNFAQPETGFDPITLIKAANSKNQHKPVENESGQDFNQTQDAPSSWLEPKIFRTTTDSDTRGQKPDS